MTDAYFDRLFPFLSDIHWQATRNAAERMGRAFRKVQAPHYNLRIRCSIEGTLKVRALRSIQPEDAAARSTRGRKRTQREQPAG